MENHRFKQNYTCTPGLKFAVNFDVQVTNPKFTL